jgi:membrane protein implicated in regulation of membrane protease activity
VLGDDPVGFLAWVLVLAVFAAASIGLLVGLAFALVMALTAANRGLAVVVRRTIDSIRARLRRAGAAGSGDLTGAGASVADPPVSTTSPDLADER